MKPFDNDSEVLTLRGLTVENGVDAVVLSGSLELRIDQESLETARKLRACLDMTIAALEGRGGDLPSKAPAVTKMAERKPNPIRR